MTITTKNKLETVNASIRFLSYIVTIITLPMILWMARRAVETIESNKDRITIAEVTFSKDINRLNEVTIDHETRLRNGKL